MNENRKRFRRTALCAVLLAAHLSRISAQSDLATEKKIDDLIGKMTLQEKVSMIHANSTFTTASVPRLGIPELVTSDGPHGVRPEQGRYWVQKRKMLDS